MEIYLTVASNGTGNPECCRRQIMNTYLADKGGQLRVAYNIVKNDENIFLNSNILQSFYYCNSFTEKVIIPSCKNFMLDSGAFTFFTAGEKVNWDDYIKKYADFITKNNIKLFFELDIDSLIGHDRVIELRKKLEYLTGKKCIPVWHKSRGIEEYIKLCRAYDYIAIGGIVSKEISKDEYKYFPELIKIAHKNKAKVHGLGFTNLSYLKRYHFDSVDSSSWTCGNRFGIIYKFDGENLISISKKTGQKLKDPKLTSVHNFKEWLKFAKYAEKNL